MHATRALVFAVLLCFSAQELYAAAEMRAADKQHIDIPAQKLEQALQLLARERGLQMVYRTEVIGELRTRGVSGDLTAEEVLQRLLSGTGLTYRYLDERMITILPAPPAGQSGGLATDGDGAIQLVQVVENPPAVAGVASAGATEAADERAAEERNADQAGTVEVTGSRIRGLLGEASFTPVITFTRRDIERAGVSTLGELGRLIPQAYSQGSYDGIGFGGQQPGTYTLSDSSIGNAEATVRTTFNLRGLGAQNTLVLLNGRRIARTGITRGNDADDLSGIPVSSIERVEVLTSGASAVYGSDAVGGVINIIQRRSYQGTQADITYENTFDSDTAVRTATLAHTFNAGNFSSTVAGTFQDRNAFAAVDRYFSATDNWKALGGTTGLDSLVASWAAGGIPLGAGAVQALSGNLPGRSTPWAVIPDGADGSPRPAADYVSANGNYYFGIIPLGVPELTGDRAKYVNLISPQTSRSASLQLSYRLGADTELYADGRFGQTFTAIEGTPVNFRNGMVVPAGYPGNPFGADVRLNKTFWELGNIQGAKDAKSSSLSFATGVTGMFGRQWRYATGFDWNRGVLQNTNAYGQVMLAEPYQAAIENEALVLFYDSRTSAPNDPDLLRSLLQPANTLDRGVSMGVTASFDGPLWELPAGALRVAAGVESRRELARTFQSIPENPLNNVSLLGSFRRDVQSAYLEVLAPLVAPKHGVPLLQRLDFSGAVRYDSYDDAGSDYTPRYGLQWRAASWLMLRATRSYAFRAPNLQSVYRPVTQSTLDYSFIPNPPVDPERGNEPLTGVITSLVGGNPALMPERSVSNNVGAVLELPFRMFDGLSLSVDLVDFKYTDRIGGADAQTIIDLFPGRLVRGAPLPGDPAGRPGRITQIDTRSLNIAQVDIRSVDYQVNYSRPTSLGSFDFRAAATVYDEYESRSLPGAAATSSSYQYPTRYTWQSYWNRGPLGLGIAGFYQERQYATTSRTTVRFDDVLEWDVQMAYDFSAAGYRGEGSWKNRLLSDLKLSLTVFNVLDTEPPHIQGHAGFAVTDPRMRRYALTLQKSFSP